MTGVPIIAYEPNRTVYYSSMSKAVLAYSLSSRDKLVQLILSRQVWAIDGYTTFDWGADADEEIVQNIEDDYLRRKKKDGNVPEEM